MGVFFQINTKFYFYFSSHPHHTTMVSNSRSINDSFTHTKTSAIAKKHKNDDSNSTMFDTCTFMFACICIYSLVMLPSAIVVSDDLKNAFANRMNCSDLSNSTSSIVFCEMPFAININSTIDVTGRGNGLFINFNSLSIKIWRMVRIVLELMLDIMLVPIFGIVHIVDRGLPYQRMFLWNNCSV